MFLISSWSVSQYAWKETYFDAIIYLLIKKVVFDKTAHSLIFSANQMRDKKTQESQNV